MPWLLSPWRGTLEMFLLERRQQFFSFRLSFLYYRQSIGLQLHYIFMNIKKVLFFNHSLLQYF